MAGFMPAIHVYLVDAPRVVDARNKCGHDASALSRVNAMLAVEGLCKRFGGFLAVNQVSFEVREGEILGLIGPNGSGKSTTFNLIAGNLRPTSGSIRLQGNEIGGLPAHAICHQGVARTFQIPRPFRKLSLLENVMLAAYFGGAGSIGRAEAQRRAGEALDMVGLPSDAAAQT